MSTRQFFVWSFWAIVITLGFPLLPAMVGAGLGLTAPAPFAVIEPGDFPANYSITREDMPWQIYPDIPRAGGITYHRIVVNRDGSPEDQQWGHVVTASYANAETADLAYEAIRREAEINGNAQPLPFGERGSQSTPAPPFNSTDILFQRCGVIVHATLEGDTLDQLLTYARRLDERITAAKCNQ